MKGLIEFGCSAKRLFRRASVEEAVEGAAFGTRELGALARNSRNPPSALTRLEELWSFGSDLDVWFEGCEIPLGAWPRAPGAPGVTPQ